MAMTDGMKYRVLAENIFRNYAHYRDLVESMEKSENPSSCPSYDKVCTLHHHYEELLELIESLDCMQSSERRREYAERKKANGKTSV